MNRNQNDTSMIGPPTGAAFVHAVRRLTPSGTNARRLRSLAIACTLGALALSIWALAVMRWSGMLHGSGG